ncbi:hypothetical protein CXG81DRAFT_17724 [Caulochytrium protostelioides]|uniref:SCP domain-containing protein n=1 Tax=Caulochytrium protostelioides TaxID=1555241 RepID=A0A4P9XC16_9FUNG|nr:hypothetical protein CXG81DRAFT_17724 [Caulochytrium protostelioides]|eukprot:RKP02671.1 hypothetical protein CXG81DRAFT_17724 [Caulochytrium protostelioides]
MARASSPSAVVAVTAFLLARAMMAMASDCATQLPILNSIRASVGVPPVACDSRISAVALNHAIDMAASKTLRHNSANGMSPFQRLTAAGIVYTTAAENVAMDGSIDGALDLFKKSSAHFTNMVNPTVNCVGYGVSGNFHTQDFAKLASCSGDGSARAQPVKAPTVTKAAPRPVVTPTPRTTPPAAPTSTVWSPVAATRPADAATASQLADASRANAPPADGTGTTATPSNENPTSTVRALATSTDVPDAVASSAAATFNPLTSSAMSPQTPWTTSTTTGVLVILAGALFAL